MCRWPIGRTGRNLIGCQIVSRDRNSARAQTQWICPHGYCSCGKQSWETVIYRIVLFCQPLANAPLWRMTTILWNAIFGNAMPKYGLTNEIAEKRRTVKHGQWSCFPMGDCKQEASQPTNLILCSKEHCFWPTNSQPNCVHPLSEHWTLDSSVEQQSGTYFNLQ